ncbi:MAG TPA: hypothetical protein VGZ73_20700 [Bryobacteraceae bacterium]|jgi:hypothetical protein|nr:hypothetical protein [Bryobacteraceae bacterium]
MTRYLPARHYLWFGITAVVLAAAFGWVGMNYTVFPYISYIAAGLALLTAVLLFAMAFRPAVEIHEGYLSIGRRVVPWMDIRRLDRTTSWIAPLIVRVTLFDDSRLLLVYPGDLDSCNSLLRHLRRLSRDALIDGIPYRQYWGEVLSPGNERKQAQTPMPRYRILRPEDEAEVERLYQRLKTVGNLDQKNSDEK